MSDYFDNLLRRSLAPAAALQPSWASYAPAMNMPPAQEQPTTNEFTDPFEQAEAMDEEVTTEPKRPTLRKQTSQGNGMRLEEPKDREPFVEPPAVKGPAPVRQPTGESGATPEEAALHDGPNSLPPNKALATPGDVSPTRARPEPVVVRAPEPEPLPVSEKRSLEPSGRSFTAPGPAKTLLSPGLPPPPSALPTTTREKAEKVEPARSHVVFSTRQSEARAVVPVSASPQILLTRSQPTIQHDPQPSSVPETISVERMPAPVEKRPSSPEPLTTLIPKISVQPLPPVSVKTRPHTQPGNTPNETAVEVEQPEMIINVAIGRIEVRAAPAETASRDRRRNGPRIMKLDEYLHQRSQGSQ